MENIEKMLNGYVECALWSSTDWADDNGGETLDQNYTPDDIHPEVLREMRADCADFLRDNADDLDSYRKMGFSWSQIGHDFWLTRNGHGAGFWDRGAGDVGDRLSESARVYAGVDIYPGDDGRICA